MIQLAKDVALRDDGTIEGSLVEAARWVSTRRTTTFEKLFAGTDRPERLTAPQATHLVSQLHDAIAHAHGSGDAPTQQRSAALTILSHVVATVLHDPSFRAAADAAAKEIFALVAAEPRAELRAHAILLLSLRAPALNVADRGRGAELLRGLVRAAPPYAELKGTWRFAMCSDPAFHDGECNVLVEKHHFKKTGGAPAGYQAFVAPWRTPSGEPIEVLARASDVPDEAREMGDAAFVGLLINRHAQLGTFDLQEVETPVAQRGYKLMMNSQCCGMATRFAVARRFPDADIYSSWDSTMFETDSKGTVTASEGLDCFAAILEGMSHGESHAQLDARVKKAQWAHGDADFPGFVQFVGPAHPLVIARFTDVDADGQSGLYDGFLDFEGKALRESLKSAMKPRDPRMAPSQIAGEAAAGLEWAAGSLDRATKYSEIWKQLPADSEQRYVFEAAGFYDQREPPKDVPGGGELGELPAVVRYRGDGSGLTGEVMFHAWLAHAPRELKRLLVAAEAMRRAFDLGHLPEKGPLATPLGQRCALLLTMVGLLEFPADPNMVDAVWSLALDALALPEIARSVVRACITDADHEQHDDYYGSFADLAALERAIAKADPLALGKLKSKDAKIGRARLLRF
jgi:hypothetical protein